MAKDYNNFKIKEDLLFIEKSPTQAIRVAIVDRDGKDYVSCQKWWRRSSDEEWIPGKGLQLNKEDTKSFIEALSEAVEKLN
ncbi:hypothetical protein F373_gp182 [Bacillus phage SP-10]|uniref:hypothetical protein n=1 Tax=Bacillus phage SP10 TaxID=941058 RepID=UPI0002198B8A|nr:hypothetical protein F373_gp182 [Bacillus phage SP-10]BAK52994.1 hypothetical protein [Bacillus phage SP-10]